MLAYVYPLLSVFWTTLMVMGALLVLFVVVWCFVDNFRRRDHHGWAKAGWTVLILFLPILGSLVYILARPAELYYGTEEVVSAKKDSGIRAA